MTKGGHVSESLVLPPDYRLIISHDFYQHLNSFPWRIAKRMRTPPTFFRLHCSLIRTIWRVGRSVFMIEQVTLSNRYKL